MLNIFKKRQSAWELNPQTYNTKVHEETLVESKPVVTVPKSVINSEVIKEDLKQSFDEVMAEFAGSSNYQTEIDVLNSQLEGFKEVNKEVYDKIASLNDLGFINTPSAKKGLTELRDQERLIATKVSNLQDKIDKLKSIDRLKKEYALKYPTYKFIDKDTYIGILSKYDLFYGDVSLYNKEVPQRALDNISNFTNQIKESRKSYSVVEERAFSHKWRNYVDYSIVKDIEAEPNTNGYNGFDYMSVMMEGHSTKTNLYKYQTSDLKIAAPSTHFDNPTIKKMETTFGDTDIEIEVSLLNFDKRTREISITVDNLEAQKEKWTEVLDPIAFLEVEGGVIILDAWDEEADIPEIQNTFNN